MKLEGPKHTTAALALSKSFKNHVLFDLQVRIVVCNTYVMSVDSSRVVYVYEFKNVGIKTQNLGVYLLIRHSFRQSLSTASTWSEVFCVTRECLWGSD